MPRQNRRLPQAPRPRAASAPNQRVEEYTGRPHYVRSVAATERVYRCPGCDQEIRGRAHVVAWPVEDTAADHRRHWHSVCWAARDTRRPVGRQR